DDGSIRESSQLEVVVDSANRGGLQIEQQGAACPPTERLNRYAARSGEQIEEARVEDVAANDVEQRLLDAIHDRSGAVARHELQLTAFRRPRDHADAHVPYSTAARTARRFESGEVISATQPVERMKRRLLVSWMALRAASRTVVGVP